MRLTAGSYRELHWRTADECAYVLHGHARVTVMKPDGTLFVGDVGEGQLWILPAGFSHSLRGLVRMERSFFSSSRKETYLRMARCCPLSGSRTRPWEC
jgi:hypothetical protein